MTVENLVDFRLTSARTVKMPRKNTKTKTALVAMRSSTYLEDRARSFAVDVEVTVAETATKRKASGAPAGAPAPKVRDRREHRRFTSY